MRVLVVVDMQKDFIDGALGSPEAQAIVPNVIEKIKSYQKGNDVVLYTADTHHEWDYDNTIEGKKLPIRHCMVHTEGWEIPEEIRMGSINVFRKEAFGSLFLPQYIVSNFINRLDSVELVGLCTDICVISNAMILKAHLPSTPIMVDAKCCAGTSPESHERALQAMEVCHIDVVR